MKKLKYILPVLFAFTIFIACSDDDDVDTTPPVIEIVSPDDHAHFHPGETIHLHAIITDDTELATWKIDIHYNSDGHTHSQIITLKHGDHDHHHGEKEWHLHKDGLIEGNVKVYELELDLIVPEDAKHGEYHLGVFAVDKAGNQSQVFIEIEVEDDDHDHHEHEHEHEH
ncbi:DUF4625 domain-containing protein [Alkalitalea saponilacus]|uniref:DUF4625 domain-containing protein n=1 Tax=Alkalitalea saponilacus TaxID=889453 RepID=A0A1T5CD67_9BACT|nr:DUF4625 domain-containing protein [Alkalitalea saponilacus]ASB49827.1 hypothetical protein CDL62_12120 [Alkalitalea saponilacus]SKB57482.1 protein of unknown function [Alkalitalea saponilacus]